MEKSRFNANNKLSSASLHNELQAFCGKCGQSLGVYIPPCNGHIFKCPKCRAELEVHATISESGNGTISCRVLSTKDSRQVSI